MANYYYNLVAFLTISLLSDLHCCSAKLPDKSKNRRLQFWKEDVISNVELLQFRDKESGLVRHRHTSAYRMLGLRTFELMTNPTIKAMRNGFPSAAHGGGQLPTLFWWVRLQGTFCIDVNPSDLRYDFYPKFPCQIYFDRRSCSESFHIQQFNTILYQMQWERLIRTCDELAEPRCSWQKFLAFLDPFAIDYYAQVDIDMVEDIGWDFYNRRPSKQQHGPIFYVPYKELSCYPIHDIDTLSAVYIYSFCMEHKAVLLNNTSDPKIAQQLRLCPNPCAGNPCERVNFATGKCQVTGFAAGEFYCRCRHNFEYDPVDSQCKPLDLCSSGKFCSSNGTSTCRFNITSGQATCVCHEEYMGRRCDERNDPCVNRWHHPAILTGNEACRVTGSSGNKCNARIGSPMYSCECSSGYLPNPDHAFSNCYQVTSPCQSRVCLYGSCIESIDLNKTACRCEHGFKGESCEDLKGLWSAWSPWSDCSPACRHGHNDVTRKRRRTCLGNAADCHGPDAELEACAQAPKCLEPLPPEANALREMRRWWGEVLIPLVAGATLGVCLALSCARLLELVLSRVLRGTFERWQMRINPPNTMGLPAAD